jgi:integrase
MDYFEDSRAMLSHEEVPKMRTVNIEDEKAAIQVLKPKQVTMLLRAPDGRRRLGKRDRALLAVLVGGGLRVGEAIRLTVSNIEHGPGSRVRLTFRTSKQKTRPYRTVTLPTVAGKAVKDWIAYSEPRLWLFVGQRQEHLGIAAAQRAVKKHLARIGRTDLHTHSLRHSYASIVVRETRSIFVAQKLLGHADPRTTAKFYAAFEVSDADAAADALSEALARRAIP